MSKTNNSRMQLNASISMADCMKGGKGIDDQDSWDIRYQLK